MLRLCSKEGSMHDSSLHSEQGRPECQVLLTMRVSICSCCQHHGLKAFITLPAGGQKANVQQSLPCHLMIVLHSCSEPLFCQHRLQRGLHAVQAFLLLLQVLMLLCAAPSSELASVREDVQQLKAAVEVLTNATHLMAIPTTSSSVAEPGMLCHAAPCCAVLRPAAPCCAVLRPAAPCCAVLRPAAPCCALPSPCYC